MTSFWTACQGEDLEQGDYLRECWVPIVGGDFDPAAREPEISVSKGNLIIVTQSCDLANDKIAFPALCPIAALETWEGLNRDYAKRGFWEPWSRIFARSSACPSLFTEARGTVGDALAFAAAVPGTLFAGIRPLLHARWSAGGNSSVQVGAPDR
jgi:hypothetical protein